MGKACTPRRLHFQTDGQTSDLNTDFSQPDIHLEVLHTFLAGPEAGNPFEGQLAAFDLSLKWRGGTALESARWQGLHIRVIAAAAIIDL